MPSADGFLGSFAEDQLSITLEPSMVGGAAPGVRSYVGTITGFGGTYPFTATSRDGTELTGQFESGGHAFAFTATLPADALTLITGGVSYVLGRVSQAPDAPVDPEEPRQARLCETPADQLRRGVPTYRRDEEGLQTRLSVKSGAARVRASNHLEVVVEGGDMRMFLNDVSLACLGSDEPIEGGIGIIAIGTGTFDIEWFTAPR